MKKIAIIAILLLLLASVSCGIVVASTSPGPAPDSDRARTERVWSRAWDQHPTVVMVFQTAAGSDLRKPLFSFFIKNL